MCDLFKCKSPEVAKVRNEFLDFNNNSQLVHGAAKEQTKFLPNITPVKGRFFPAGVILTSSC